VFPGNGSDFLACPLMPRPSPKPFQWIYPARMGRALGTTEKRAGGLLHAPLGTRLKFWENVNLAASVLHHHTGTLTALESAKDLFSFTLNVNGTPAAQGYASGPTASPPTSRPTRSTSSARAVGTEPSARVWG
jgi:hypothetical protein